MNELKEPKVLVAAPIYEGKHYIFPIWYKLVTNLSYPNYDLMIVDNSKTISYSTKLRRLGYRFIHHVNRGGNSRYGIAAASETIRQRAIDGGYDYIMFIESDLLPPKDIIQRLMKHKLRIVGATYEIGIKGNKNVPRKPLIYKETIVDGNLKLEIEKPEDGYALLNTGLHKTPACGFGSTLIHKSIFSKYSFKHRS